MNRVIIFAPNWLGDAVMALPAIADVRRGSPGATIAVAARPSVAPLFTMVPDVDEIVVTEKRGRVPFPPKRSATPFDVAILLPNSFHSALIARRDGIRERWGYRTDWRGLLLTRAVTRARGIHQIESYQRLVQALGFPNGPSAPRLDVPPAVRAAAACALERAGWDKQAPIVAIAPGAAYGGSRRWPADRFAAVARSLASEGVRPVMVGSAADAPTGRSVESALGNATTMLNLIGRTDLPTLAGVLAGARGLVSNDSGAMHLGAAIGLPVAAILGPTNERITGPRADQRLVVLQHPVWCSPCLLRECPIGHRCMRGVSVEAVLDATRRML